MNLVATMIPAVDPWLAEEGEAAVSDFGPVSKPAHSRTYQWQKRCPRCRRIFHPRAWSEPRCEDCAEVLL